MERQDFKFYTVEEFKSKIGALNSAKVEVIKNPNTGKLFVAVGDEYFKCQQDFDAALNYKFMVAEGDSLEDACLVNCKESSNVVFSLD